MNKKIILFLAFLLCTSTALFAQSGEIIRIGEQLFLQTVEGKLIPITISKGTIAGVIDETLNQVAIDQSAKIGLTGANKVVTGTSLEPAKTPNPKTIDNMPTFRSDFPNVPELQERIKNAVNAVSENVPSDLFIYERIKNEVEEDLVDPSDEKAVLKLQQDYSFMREQWNRLVLTNGLDNVHKVRMALSYKLQKGVDAQLAEAYAQLDKFIGKNLHFPQKGTKMREYIDGQLARFPMGIHVSEKIKYLTYLRQQQDFWDGLIPSAPQKFYSKMALKYDFMPALKSMREKYGNEMPTLAFKNDKAAYIALEDALIFRSVGAPTVHITEKFSTLENYHFGEAIFQVPEDLQQAYMESVFDRLDDFIKKNRRYPYFSADAAAKKYIYDRVTQQLTDEARLHLAVRRALAFPENSESHWLKDLAEKGKEMVGTKLHDAELPAVTY